jgi:hypothetical protein
MIGQIFSQKGQPSHPSPGERQDKWREEVGFLLKRLIRQTLDLKSPQSLKSLRF